MRLIELDEAIAETWKDTGYSDPLNVMTALRDRLEALPTVDAVPVRHGRWERGLDKDGDWISVCSVCGEVALYDKADDAYLHTVFCPWCGARMDGDDNGKT